MTIAQTIIANKESLNSLLDFNSMPIRFHDATIEFINLFSKCDEFKNKKVITIPYPNIPIDRDGMPTFGDDYHGAVTVMTYRINLDNPTKDYGLFNDTDIIYLYSIGKHSFPNELSEGNIEHYHLRIGSDS